MAHQLIESFKAKKQSLNLLICDPFGIGGRIWSTKTDPILLMNTPSRFVTLFNHAKPTLYEWSQSFGKRHLSNPVARKSASQLKPNDAAPRYLYADYLNWFASETKARLPKSITFKLIKQPVSQLNQQSRGFRVVFADQQSVKVDRVIINVGSLKNQPKIEDRSLEQYARAHSLNYLAKGLISNQAKTILPNQKIIIRGLGLNCFDYLRSFTVGRGGQFERQGHHLKYLASGKEPQIIAGSRRGLPYYPQSSEVPVHFHFLNAKSLKQHSDQHGRIKVKPFEQLLKYEVISNYYRELIRQKYPQINWQAFLHKLAKAPKPQAMIRNSPIQVQDQLTWQKLINPVAGLKITTLENYQSAVTSWLARITDQVDHSAPILAAISCVKRASQLIGRLIANRKFEKSGYLRFIVKFRLIQKFLTAGPSSNDLRKLLALINAGIVKIMGPRLHVVGAAKHFIAASFFYPKEMIKADGLVEARIPRFSTRNSRFLRQLVRAGTISLDQFGYVKVNPNYQVTATDGQSQTGLYLWGTGTFHTDWSLNQLPQRDDFKAVSQITESIINPSAPSF